MVKIILISWRLFFKSKLNIRQYFKIQSHQFFKDAVIRDINFDSFLNAVYNPSTTKNIHVKNQF